MGQSLSRHRMWSSSTLVTMTFRLVHWTMGWNETRETPCRIQRSLGHQHLGARSLKGDGSTVFLNSLCFQK